MEYEHLIKASSMIRAVLGNIIEETSSEEEIKNSLEKLKADLDGFEQIID